MIHINDAVAEDLILLLDGTLLALSLVATAVAWRHLGSERVGRPMVAVTIGLVLLGLVHATESGLDQFGVLEIAMLELTHRALVLTALLWLLVGLWLVACQLLETLSTHQQTEELLEDARSALEVESRRLSAALDRMTDQARRDPLTGVLNHGALSRLLSSMVTRGESAAVIIVDVDDLKALNDTYGHLVGDRVLRFIAGAMAGERVTVGRYGGDEFLAVLQAADRAETEMYVAALRSRLASSELRDEESGAPINVSVSIGVAMFPDDAARIEDLIRLADGAMYAEKRQRVRARGSQRTAGKSRAAAIVGELVPLLVQGQTLDAKLALVASHISSSGRYHAVHFDVYDSTGNFRDENTTVGSGTVSDASPDLIDAWVREERSVVNHPVREALERTQRPVILDDVTTDQRLTENERALLGATGIRSGISVPLLWHGGVIGSLSVGKKRRSAIHLSDAEFLVEVAAHAAAIIWTERLVSHLQTATHQLTNSRDDTVMMLAASVEAHDPATGRHLLSVQRLSEMLALELGWSAAEAQRLGMAAVLHDVGKVRVPDAILRGSGRLTEDEWTTMRQHTQWGADFLASRPGFELAATVARAHHERWDGAGYPRALAGDTIPEAAAIVAVADSFDAMTSDRSYRAGRSVPEAMREIVGCSGRQFSPAVVSAVVRLYRRRQLDDHGAHDGDTKLAA